MAARYFENPRETERKPRIRAKTSGYPLRIRSIDQGGSVVLPAILNPFVEGAPAAVMTRIALDWIIDGTPLDELFHEVAEDQYTRELTLTHFVQVMLDVASGHRPSPRAAFLRRELPLVASLSAFYRKLNRMGPAIPEAVVRRTASRARQLIVASDGLMPEPVQGYAARILDGNVMTG